MKACSKPNKLDAVVLENYKVTVYTSDKKFAGTDADVSIEIRGTK